MQKKIEGVMCFCSEEAIKTTLSMNKFYSIAQLNFELSVRLV